MPVIKEIHVELFTINDSKFLENDIFFSDHLEFHFTPIHASLLNMVEIKFSVLNRQYFNRRIPMTQQLQQEVDAWADQRNSSCQAIDWRFTTVDVHIRLKKLYPSYS